MPAQQSGNTGNIFRKVDYRFNKDCIPVSNNGILLNWKNKIFSQTYSNEHITRNKYNM